MVIGYHVIFGAYGFWLPNDPRGSWSDFVGSWELFRYGSATKTNTTQSVAGQPHDVRRRLAAKEALKYPAVQFTGVQARAVGRGFAAYIRKSGLVVRSCAILPDHVHLVIDRFRLPVEQIVIQLKGEATAQLLAENLHPFGSIRLPNGRPPRCWARGEWSVFLEDAADVWNAIQYVDDNPPKEGKPRQRWSFVTRDPVEPRRGSGARITALRCRVAATRPRLLIPRGVVRRTTTAGRPVSKDALAWRVRSAAPARRPRPAI
jgi:REP element-mobilizing transposase RayT